MLLIMASPSAVAGFTQPDEEIFYSTYEPTKEEIIEYAVKIGIDPDKEANLTYLARQGLLHPLPENWKPCYSKQVKAYYYYDRITKKSQWEHPIDVLYRTKVIEARKALSHDPSDSTSFVDSGFRSLKSNHAGANLSQHPQPSSPASALPAASIPDSGCGPIKPQQVKTNNHDADDAAKFDDCCIQYSVQEYDGGVTAAQVHDESDSNKENNSQEGGQSMAKTKGAGTETALVLAKKIAFIAGAGVHDIRTEFTDSGRSIVSGKMDQSSFHGFTITGTGSQFLKSNNKKLELGTLEPGRGKSESEMKGILRDTSLTYVRSKGTPNEDSGTDERKSVRFDIDIGVAYTAHETGAEMYDDEDDDARDDSVIVRTNVKDNDDTNADADDDDRLEEQEDELSADREEQQVSSTETSQQDSEQSVGVVFAITNDLKVNSTVPKPANSGATDDCDDVDSLRLLRKSIGQERARYKTKLEAELRSLAELEEINIQNELTKERRQYEELLTIEKQRLKDQHQKNVDEVREFYQIKLGEMKADYEEENAKEYAVYQETLREEFDRRVKEVTDTHRATMATLQKNHDEIVEELERDLKMEEELLKKEHSTNLTEIKIKLNHELEMERQRMRETGEDRLYEKVRCEKRLLEDKYKCLKEKYTRLKTDVRISLERRKKRREQQQAQQQQHSLLSNSCETDERTNSKPLPSYVYEMAKGISGPSSINTLATSDKSSLSNPSQTAASKRLLGTGAGYALESQANPPNCNGTGKGDQRKSTFILSHNNNNGNVVNNNKSSNIINNKSNNKNQVDDSSQSEARYPKHYFQVRNIFASAQHDDNFSSDSEFNKISYEHGGGVENSCSSSQAGGATTVARPKRRIFTKTKSSSTSKLNSIKLERDAGVTRPCTPVENLRIQLKKLEELEDQIPDCNLDAPYHLRYPFVNNINQIDNSKTTTNVRDQGGKAVAGAITTTDNSELEFFKHRILLERDSVMRAKESLRAQKNLFKSKQRDISVKHAIKNKQTMDQMFNEEKELAEMEVSLHRTRALLGEKVIRLRHLENSLQKLSEKTDHPIRHHGTTIDMALKPKETLSDLSSYSSSGFSSTDIPTTEHHCSGLRARVAPANVDTNETLMYLRHLHAEIQEIWTLLNSNTGAPPPAAALAEMDFLNNTTGTLSGKHYFDMVLPPKPITPTFNQSASVAHSMGPQQKQPTVNHVQNQHHYTVTLLEKTRELKNWLQKAKSEHEKLEKQSLGCPEIAMTK
uniref:WW domain-containing protein n=1 Tax=Anopheles farauti TaxID=69004 RepID=A0A182QSW4_9DIPT